MLLSRQSWLGWQQRKTAHRIRRPWQMSADYEFCWSRGSDCCCQCRCEANMNPEVEVHAQLQPPADTSCLPVL